MESNNSLSFGFMAAFAVSGSVVLIACQLHKLLLSDFMKKMEFELGSGTRRLHGEEKKKVRFADNVVEPSSNNKEYRKRHSRMRQEDGEGLMEDMPLNRQMLYKGIIQYSSLKGFNNVSLCI